MIQVSTGLDSLGGYEQGDLVVLGQTNVGVITRVGRDDFQVLNQNDVSVRVRLQEPRGKRNSSSARAAALDRNQNHIQSNDVVNVVDGPHKGQLGTIKHMYRAFLFLHSNKRMDNSGTPPTFQSMSISTPALKTD